MLLDIILLMVFHFVGDFILQSDYMSVNRSKDFGVLVMHCACYSAVFLFFGITFALLTFGLHLLVDLWTIEISDVLWKRGTRHWFFAWLGFDQLMHQVLLILTYGYLFGAT